jgi:acetylglutamate kinase
VTGPRVIKVGGSTLDDPGATFSGIAALVDQGDIPVVVHGGGPEASRWLKEMNIPSKFVRGLRVTDDAVLPVIVAVYAGLVNKRIVTALAAAGVRAVGISGADGGMVQCSLVSPELGHVGEPSQVDPAPVTALLDAGFVPVVGPVCVAGRDGQPELVNVNADQVATSLAAALGASELVYLTDVPGVHGPEGDIIPSLTADEVKQLIEAEVITGGMIPKVESCLRAVEHGVPARILDARTPDTIANPAAGTRVIPG